MEKELDATEYPERGDFEEKALGGVLTRLADHFEDAMPDTDTNYGLPGLLAELKPPQNVISIHRERGLRSQVCGPAGGADAWPTASLLMVWRFCQVRRATVLA